MNPPPTRGGASLALAILLAGLAADTGAAQNVGEWRYWGGDAASTRYSPLDQIDATNFAELEVAWIWRGDNFGPSIANVMRSTPLYVDGTLYTVAGLRRTVAAIDPATGETLWTFREPHTQRWEDSPRQSYGKGVAYHRLADGRGVIYVATPGFFLHALDAATGQPLEGFGQPVPVAGFGEHGTVDMLADLDRVGEYDAYRGPSPSVGHITTSSPPIVVNGVVIVGSSAGQGTYYSRIEHLPGDVLAYDARTGAHLWTFHVIPQPGEAGHETWENDAWSTSGNVNAWVPLSADLERGLVYVPTDAPTNDFFGGFRPGANLFGTSVIALDVITGERVWHFQTVHHDIWDYDNPVAPVLLDITVGGVRVPALVQTTKQGLAYTFNRVTGEPVWPVVETTVPQSAVPGETTSPTQPIPTRPAPFEMQGLTHDDLIDWTPELRVHAIEAIDGLKLGPLFNPAVHRGNEHGYRAAAVCPSITGGNNIIGGTVADPETGIMYVASVKSCTALALLPGAERDDGSPGLNTGVTVVDWIQAPTAFGSVEGLSVLKPPYGRITAIDMNTGEHLWWIPNGDTPERVADHPLLAGIDIGNTGQPSHATALVTRSLLIYGEGRTGEPRLHAVDKLTGDRIATIDLPARSSTAPMTYLHDGRQYIIVPIGGGGYSGSLAALALPQRE